MSKIQQTTAVGYTVAKVGGAGAESILNAIKEGVAVVTGADTALWDTPTPALEWGAPNFVGDQSAMTQLVKVTVEFVQTPSN